MTEWPASVRLETAGGSLPRLLVETPTAAAEIYPHGAHVTSWRPAGHEEVLFLSRASRFAEGSAIRGGVPLCFPWFGPGPVPGAPAHGFARVSQWSVRDVQETGDDVVVTLGLADSLSTRASAWPHRFAATLRVTVGRTLRLDLTVHNHEAVPVPLEAALHTYLRVADARRVRIAGLEGVRYVDKLGGPEPVPGEPGPITLTGETDRIYLDPGPVTTVEDPAGGRRVRVHGHGSATTVVWNPWTERAAAMADLEDDEWTAMVCVETSDVGPAAVTLQPGAAYTLTSTLEVAADD